MFSLYWTLQDLMIHFDVTWVLLYLYACMLGRNGRYIGYREIKLFLYNKNIFSLIKHSWTNCLTNQKNINYIILV